MQAIEQGIPIPPKNRGGRKRKYRFADLAVGESFYVECRFNEAPGRVSNRLSACAAYYRPAEFRRAVEGAGVRVWRVV